MPNTTDQSPTREPLPASFKPFWRFLLLMLALTVAIGVAAAITGLALTD